MPFDSVTTYPPRPALLRHLPAVPVLMLPRGKRPDPDWLTAAKRGAAVSPRAAAQRAAVAELPAMVEYQRRVGLLRQG